MKGKYVDLIVHNAQIHSMNERMTIYEAMAVKDGKIVELGPERQILNKYSAEKVIDARNRDVYPGFTDSHINLLTAAKQRIGVDLSGCKSYAQLLIEVEIYQQRNKKKIVVGYGWNENLWRDSALPDNEQLNELFPDVPVCLFRNDGRYALVNTAMLDLVGVDSKDVFYNKINDRGDIDTKGIVTGDDLIKIREVLPVYSQKELKDKIIEIQGELLMYGVTNIHEANLDFSGIKLVKELIDEERLKLNLYGMLAPTEENIQFAKKEGVYNYKNLSVRSFKVYSNEFFSNEKHLNSAIVEENKLTILAQLCIDLGYQLNVSVMDSVAVKKMLNVYKNTREFNPDHRWRMEHIRSVAAEDISLFAKYNIFPSVQPIYTLEEQTTRPSDVLGVSYPYQSLLKSTGMLTVGTNYPFGDMNPFKTIYAACVRDRHEREVISLESCLKGMTVWAALAGFQEDYLGRLEVGMDATFSIFERKLIFPYSFQQNFSLHTYINGREVYTAE